MKKKKENKRENKKEKVKIEEIKDIQEPKEQLTIYLPRKMVKDLKVISLHKDIQLSDIFREMTQEYLKKYELTFNVVEKK